MENFYAHNMGVLRLQYPALAAKLDRIDPLPLGDLSVTPSESGLPTLAFQGLHIHSLRDPWREAQRQAAAIAAGEGPVLILGFGLGYSASAVAEAFPGRPLIILEKHWEILRAALEARRLDALFAAAPLALVMEDIQALQGALALFKGKPTLLPNRALVDADREWYQEAESAIRAWSSVEEVNAATLKRFGKRWVRNLGANMWAIRDKPGIDWLRNCIQGRDIPVLLAAAGPSLDRIAPALNELAERCLVIAVDTSLRFFCSRGVYPDFAVALDPQWINSRHLDHVQPAGISLIAESAVCPAILRAPFQRVFLCSSQFPLGRYIEERLDPKGPLGAGGSVATTAWDFSRHIGAERIWIAGLDLAYPELKTHFHGARFEEQVHSLSNRFAPGETWSVRALRDGHPFQAPNAEGKPVLTDTRLSLYSTWFEARFRQYPRIDNYSLSPGGLAILGMETRALEDLLALPPRRAEIQSLLQEAFMRVERAFYSQSQMESRETQYRDAQESLLQGLTRLEGIAAEGAALVEQARRTPPAGNEFLDALDSINQRISESSVKDIASFLFPPIAEVEAGLRAADPLLRHIELSASLYHSLGEAAKNHLDALKAIGEGTQRPHPKP